MFLFFHRFLAFGAGRRVCTGEVLTKNRLFLILSCLLQSFDFDPVVGQPRPNHDARDFKPGIGMSPKNYEIIAVPRDGPKARNKISRDHSVRFM